MNSVDLTEKLYQGRTKEEIRVLSQDASATFDFKLGHSANLTVRKVGDSVSFVDAGSQRQLAKIETPFAVDSKGARYGYTYDLKGDVLTLRPTSSLAEVSYPLVIDPSYTIVAGAVADSTGWNNQRRLARSSNGDLHAVYYRVATTKNNIFYAKSTDGGRTWTETNLTNDGTYNQQYPSIAVDASDNLHVFWEGTDAGSPGAQQIRYKKYTAGTGWDASPTDLTTDTAYVQHYPTAAVDSSNSVHVVWTGGTPAYNQIRYRKYTAGTGWGAVANLTTDTADQMFPSIAIDSSNNLHVAWYTLSTHLQIRYKKYTVGVGWGATTDNLNSDNYDQIIPSVAVDASDNVHVVWEGNTTSTPYVTQIRYRKYTAGTGWGVVSNLTTDPTYNQDRPTIAVDSSNNLHVVWHGNYTAQPTNSQIRYLKYTAGTGWDASITNLTNSASAQQFPNLIWARWPSISGNLTNRPVTGYAFTWCDGTTVKYYCSSDLEFVPRSGSSLLSYGSTTTGMRGQKSQTFSNTSDRWSGEASGPVPNVGTKWTVLRASPANAGVYLMGMVTTETSGNFKVYGYSGGVWTLEFTATQTAAQTNCRLFDIGFDDTGRALVTYGQSTSTTAVYYRTGQWSGSNFGLGGAAESSFGFNTSVGDLRWMNLSAKLAGSQMMLSCVGTGTANNISAAIWNGSSFGNQPTVGWGSVNDTTTWDFDSAWQTSSGDGLVAWGTTAAPYWKYAVWSGGSWSGVTGGQVMATAVRQLVLDPDPSPSSNRVAVGLMLGTSRNVYGASWSGSAWSAPTMLGANHSSAGSGRQVDVKYAGTSGYAVLALDDTQSVLSWAHFSATDTAWHEPAASTPSTRTIGGGTSPNIQLVADPSGSNRVMCVRLDSNSDLYACYYNDPTTGATANTWTDTNAGSAIELDSSGGSGASATESYMFAYQGYPSLATQRTYQRSYRFQNDDGSNIAGDSNQAAADTSRTSVKRGERLSVRIQIDNTGTVGDSSAYWLQYDKNDNNWTTVTPTGEIRPAPSLSATNGASITTSICATNPRTWTNGVWQSNAASTPAVTLGAGTYSELGFMINTGSATVGTTYRFRLINSVTGTLSGGYVSYPTLTVVDAAHDLLRYSKESTGALSTGPGDLGYFLDDNGYTDVSANDGVRDAVTATAGLYPVFLFKAKDSTNTNSIAVTWDGQSSVNAAGNPVYLQVYDNVGGAWSTIATNTTAGAGSDFSLATTLTGSTAQYHDASNWVAVRVYQAAGAETLRTDLVQILLLAAAPPNAPTSLGQADASSTTIAVGGSTADGVITNLFLTFSMSSGNATDLLTPKIEIEPTGTAFTGVATTVGPAQAYSGSALPVTMTVSGLTTETSYHWQAWVSGNYGDSTHTSFGGNPEAATDFRVVSALRLTIVSTYNWDGSSGGGAVNFGTTMPATSTVVHPDPGKHAVELSVWANSSWGLSTSAPDFSSGGNTMPVGYLAWRPKPVSGSWTAFQNLSSTILSSQPPTTTADLRYDYEVTPDFNIIPGTYTTSVTYTLASP